MMSAPDLEFSSVDARRTWSRFKRDLAYRYRDLPPEDRIEAVAEAAAHIYEAIADAPGDTEHARLTAALAGFGELPAAPPAWRKPLGVALHQGAILILGVTGFFLAVLLHMAVMEVLNPDAVGLYVHSAGDFTLSYEIQPQSREVLGGWFIQAILGFVGVAGAALYGLYRLAIASTGPVSGWIRE